MTMVGTYLAASGTPLCHLRPCRRCLNPRGWMGTGARRRDGWGSRGSIRAPHCFGPGCATISRLNAPLRIARRAHPRRSRPPHQSDSVPSRESNEIPLADSRRARRATPSRMRKRAICKPVHPPPPPVPPTPSGKRCRIAARSRRKPATVSSPGRSRPNRSRWRPDPARCMTPLPPDCCNQSAFRSVLCQSMRPYLPGPMAFLRLLSPG